MPYPIHFRLALPPGCQLANYSDYSELVFPPELVSEVSTWFTTTKDRFDCESSGRAAEANAELCTNCEKGIVKVNGASQLCPNCFGSCRAGFRPYGVVDPNPKDGSAIVGTIEPVQNARERTDLKPSSKRLNIQALSDLLARSIAGRLEGQTTEEFASYIYEEITTL